MSSSREEPIHPAATVIVLRDGGRGLEVLLLERASTLAFHGGAWVFPGGRVELHERQGLDLLEASRRAAVRECFEEARLCMSPSALVPFSHWTTPQGLTRRFATWFFVVLCPEGAQVVPDGHEIRSHRWLSPDEALRAHQEGALELPPPTFVTLHGLAQEKRACAVLEASATRPCPIFVPRPQPVPEGIVSLYAGDAAYEDGHLDRPGPRHRLHMLKSGFRYERSLTDHDGRDRQR